MSGKEKKKTWQITAIRQSGSRDEYFIKASDLYEAFRRFHDAYAMYNLAELRIREGKHNEEKEEKPGAGVS